MADKDNIEELASWAEMEKVLAVVRAGAIDMRAYIVVQRKLREATRAVYVEGNNDGYRLATVYAGLHRNGED